MIIKRLLMLILVLSVFSLSQRCIWGNFNIKIATESSNESGEHFHEHSLLSEVKFFVLGFLVHSHEHTHDDRDPHDASSSKTHSHAEISQVKTDFIAGQNFLFFSSSFQSIFGISILNLHVYDHPFKIFRPPIYT